MKITKRQLKRIIREEYSRLQRRGLIRESWADQPADLYYGRPREEDPNVMEDNHDACVQKCFAAIPPMMKQICKLGMAHTVMNDIYHICKPICDKMGCDCDLVSEEVEKMCCN